MLPGDFASLWKSHALTLYFNNFETLLGAKFHRFSSVLCVLLLYMNK